MSVASILIVEDDPGLRTLIARTLRESGYEVRTASSGAEMWVVLEQVPADLILIDIMLPGSNGFDLVRMLRARSQVPIIFISARGEETDRVVGLEIGADDYLVKPFGTKELVARVRALLRRSTEPAAALRPGAQARFAGWTIDFRKRELTSPAGAAVDLSGAEFDLLTSFLDNPQRVIGRDRLLELSRSRPGDPSDRSVDVLISRLRRKLSDEVGASELIRTVRGVGYIFTVDVERH